MIDENITMRDTIIPSFVKQRQTDSLTIVNAEKDINKADENIQNLERINMNLVTDNQWLKQEVEHLKEAGLKWFHYAGGGTLILVIGILTGMLIK